MSFVLFGQSKDNVLVKGKVINSTTNELVAYASAALLSVIDSSVIASALTGEDGKFQFSVPPGTYQLKIQFISYTDHKSTITIPANNRTFDVGFIQMNQESKTLNEVVIIEEKRQIEMSADKITYNPDKDLTVTGGTAADVLKNTPLVTVNNDGSISLQGKPEVRVLINGRQSSLTGTAALQQLPAGAIDKVEVMTNPSAKYDAEGGAGIINIVLKKNKKLGLNGMITAKGGIRHDDNASINLGYGGTKWKTDASYSLRYFQNNGEFKNKGTYYFPEQVPYSSVQATQALRLITTNNVSLGTEFTPNDKNSFYSSLIVQKLGSDNTNKVENSTVHPPNTITTTHFLSAEDEENSNVDYSLDYTHSFSKEKEKQKLTGNFSMSYWDNIKTQKNASVFPATISSAAGRDTTQQSIFTDLNKTYNFQMDYVHPIKEHTIEAGIKNYIRDMHSDFTNRSYDTPEGNLILQPNIFDTFHYIDWISAAYLNYSTKVKAWKIQVGVRGEQTNVHADLHSAGMLDRNYLNFFPSFYLTKELTKSNKLSLSASRRINRPQVYNLYPFGRYPDPFNNSKGNMNLMPQYMYYFELSHSLNLDKTTLITKLNSGISKGDIEEIRTVQNGVNIGRAENLNGSFWGGVNIVLNQTLTKWWSVNGSTSEYHEYLDGKNLGFGTSNYFGNYNRLASNFKLPYKTNLQINYFYMGRFKILQRNQDPTYYFDLALKKEFFQSKGNLTFQITDIFSTWKFQFINTNPDYILNSAYYPMRYRYTLTFTYKFNNYKETQRREIQNGGGGMDR